MSPKRVREALKKARRQPSFQAVVIKKNLSQDEVALIEMEKIEMPGVDVDVAIQRTSIHKEVGAHVLGYISSISPKELKRLNRTRRRYRKGDSVGKFGLEQQWEKLLRGQDGVEYLEVDALGRKKKDVGKDAKGLLGDLASRSVVPGKNFILTIDQDLQIAAAKAFGEEKTGAVVALDPSNGEILSMLSWPSYNNTEFSIGIREKYWAELNNNKDKPLLDKTIQNHYSPGSTFKIISAIAGLEEGLITGQTTIIAGGTFRFGGRPYHEWKQGGFGKTNVVKALTRSVDVFFWKLATRIDIDTLGKYARMFGLGKRTGVELPQEITGLVPSRAWKLKATETEWYKGETLSVIIGQGALNVTPIQLANMISAVANGGTLYKPRLVKYVESSEGEIIKSTKPEIIGVAKFKESTMKLIRKGLEGVLNFERNGTAKWAAIPGIKAAGKSGTTQVIRISADKIYRKCKEMEKKFRHHGLFVAYAPADNPKIAVAAVAEHSCSGSGGAAPIAMAVIKAYLSKIMPEKYGPEILKKAQTQFWKKRAAERKKRAKKIEAEAEAEAVATEAAG